MSIREVISEAGISIAVTKGIVDVLSIASGATHGFLHAQGIDLGTFGTVVPLFFPFIAKPLTGGYAGLINGISDEDNQSSSYPEFVLKGGATGIGLGTIEYGAGFCVGYTAGGLLK